MNFSTKPAACGETVPQKREQLQEKTVKLTFLGHACFLVQAGAHTLILDPFLTNSRTAAMRAAHIVNHLNRMVDNFERAVMNYRPMLGGERFMTALDTTASPFACA